MIHNALAAGREERTWGKMARFSQDMLCTIDLKGQFVQVSDASSHIIGYESFELRGRHFSEFVHPEDLPRTVEVIAEVMGGSMYNNLDIRFIHKDGHTTYTLWGGAWAEEDRAIYAIVRDITDLKIRKPKLEESEHRYKALFEQSQDVILLENPEGKIIDVNQSFCEALGVLKEEAINSRVSSFFPQKMAMLSEEGFQAAMAGETIKFTLEFGSERKKKIFDALKSPITANGKIIGVQTIAKDITENVRSYETIQQQATKLNTIFESITDAFLMLSPNWVLSYVNSEAERLLGLDRRKELGRILLDIFPEEAGGEFHTQYLYAMETGKAVHFTTFLKRVNLWLKVKAFPSIEGLSLYFEDVTEQEKAKLELEKLSLVASATTNGVIITDKTRSIEWVNEGFTRLTGYSMEEAMGRKPNELLQRNEVAKRLHAPEVEVIQAGEPISFEILTAKKDGEEMWNLVHLNPIHDSEGQWSGHVAVMTDITERVNTQRELEKLSLVASLTNSSVLIADKDWRIEWVNNGFTKLYGYNLEEAVGIGPSELLHSSTTNKGAFAAQESRLLGGEPISFEVMNLKKSGEELWVSVEISPVFNQSGELSRYVEVQTDITALKRSEQEQSRLASDLYRQNSDLQQFTYMVSHNLRSPVANAMGLTELLASIDKDSDKFASTLTFLSQSIHKLDQVLRDMNTVLSIRDRRGNLEHEEVDVREIVNQALHSLKEEMGQAKGAVSIDIAEGFCLKAAKAYLFSIFYNLLSNAIKYRSDDRTLSIQVKCIRSAERGTIIRFSDNGSGFNMRKVKGSAFKLYQRFHNTKEGRGMGLYLVKAHVEAMGGHVKVSSKVGVGTRFLIYFPNTDSRTHFLHA